MSVTRLRAAKIDVRREPTGMMFPVGITFDDWRGEVAALQAEHKSAMWWLGDAANFGEDKFGEMYAEAIEHYSIETIQTAMRVCRAFPMQRRRPIGFYYHQAAYKLAPAEQDELLSLVEKDPDVWTREAMRQEIRRRRQEKEAAEAAKQPALQVVPGGGRENAEPAPEVEDEEEKPIGEPDEAAPIRAPANDPEAYYESDNLRVPGSEQEVYAPSAEPMAADDAAAMLSSMAEAAFPENIARAIRALLVEREKLLRVAKSAGVMIKMQFRVSPGLIDAIAALKEP